MYITSAFFFCEYGIIFFKTYRKKGVWEPIVLTDEYNQTVYKPYEYIYGKYDFRADLQSLYKTYGKGKASMLKGVDRIKLMQLIYENSPNDKVVGCGFNLDRMIHEKCLEAAFPLHDYDELQDLSDEWLELFAWPNKQPFTKIVNYFGEKLGLYFLFLGHYTNMLIFPSLLGLGAYIYYEIVGKEYEAVSLPVFGIIMLVWSTVYFPYIKYLIY